MAIQLWKIQITDERKGPRGGKAKPVVTRYVVAAETREEARALFEAEMPGHLEHSDLVSIAETGSRVAGVR